MGAPLWTVQAGRERDGQESANCCKPRLDAIQQDSGSPSFLFERRLPGVRLAACNVNGAGSQCGLGEPGLAVHNSGGVLGVLLWAGLVTRFGSRGPLLSGALATAGSALLIPLVPVQMQGGGRTLLLLALGVNGLLINAVQTSMYALATHVYPTAVRASGVAFAAAVGRVGAIASSLSGAAIIGAGAGAYWGTLAAVMLCTFAGLAWVRSHYPALGRDPDRSASA